MLALNLLLIKSTNIERIKENIEAINFKMDIDDYNRIVDDHDFGFWGNPYSYFNSVSHPHYMCISTNLRVLYEHHYIQVNHLLNNFYSKINFLFYRSKQQKIYILKFFHIYNPLLYLF